VAEGGERTCGANHAQGFFANPQVSACDTAVGLTVSKTL